MKILPDKSRWSNSNILLNRFCIWVYKLNVVLFWYVIFDIFLIDKLSVANIRLAGKIILWLIWFVFFSKIIWWILVEYKYNLRLNIILSFLGILLFITSGLDELIKQLSWQEQSHSKR